jgi:outer membrane protein TolC
MKAPARIVYIAFSAALACACPAAAADQPAVAPAAAAAAETLNWSDCVREAAKNHPDLIASQESVKQSEAAKKITGSSLLPQVDASLSATRTRSSTSSGNSDTRRTSNNYSYGANASQLIFDGSKTKDNVNAAQENILASRQSYRFISSEVRLRLRTAFINLLKAQEMITVTGDIEKMRRSDYELITLRYQSGYEHRGALMTAEASLAQADFQVAQAKRDIEQAQWQLTKEMGRKDFVPMSVKGDFTVLDLAKERPDFEVLAKNNPSLQKIIAQKNAAQFGLKAANASYWPTITGQAGANRSGPRWAPQNGEADLGLTVSLPIFEGGLRSAQVAQADAQLKQLEANERSTRDGIVVALAQAWASLQDAAETVEVQNKQLAAAQERATIAETEYSTGFLTYDNWTIIQDNLVQAKTSFLNAQANALLAEANWIQAKGEVLENAL